jgi:hypothetical protein
MNPTRGDLDLRERFAALRDADAAGAPPLSRVMRGGASRPAARRPGWAPVAALATAAALTAIAIVRTSRAPEPSLDEAIVLAQAMSSWTAPTDEWLVLSGLEIPDSVPSLSLSSVTLPDDLDDATLQGDTP